MKNSKYPSKYSRNFRPATGNTGRIFVRYQLLSCSVFVRDITNYCTGSSMDRKLGNAGLGTYQCHCRGRDRHSVHYPFNLCLVNQIFLYEVRYVNYSSFSTLRHEDWWSIPAKFLKIWGPFTSCTRLIAHSMVTRAVLHAYSHPETCNFVSHWGRW